jgi:hypothetical protein
MVQETARSNSAPNTKKSRGAQGARTALLSFLA